MNQFLERQTAEREHERTEYDKNTEVLTEQLKEQKKDLIKLESEVIFVEYTDVLGDFTSKIVGWKGKKIFILKRGVSWGTILPSKNKQVFDSKFF